MAKEALDYFGRGLMKEVRDRAIGQWDRTIEGKMQDAIRRAAAVTFGAMRREDIETIRWMIPMIVDTALHDLLAWLDWDKSVQVLIRVGSGEPTNAQEASDHLPGELFTEDGWIMRFSQERYDQRASEGT